MPIAIVLIGGFLRPLYVARPSYANSFTQGRQGSAARVVSHNLENPSRRSVLESVEPIVGGPECVALNLETITGGRTHNLSCERHGPKVGQRES